MKFEEAMNLKQDINQEIELEVYMTKNTYSVKGKLLAVEQDPELTETEKRNRARRRTWLKIKLTENVRHPYSLDSFKKGQIAEIFINKIKEWVVSK